MKNKEQLEADGRRLGLSDSATKRYVKVENVRQKEQAAEERRVEKQMKRIEAKLKRL